MHARSLAISILAGVFLAILGPFGTADAPFFTRLWYWVGVVVLAGPAGLAAYWLVSRWRPLGGKPWLQAVAMAVVMTPPTTLLVWAVSRFAFGGEAAGAAIDYALPVLVISLGMAAVNLLAARRAAEVAAPSTPSSGPPRFLKRLPEKLQGAELHAIQAEDHYLRVHTSKGTDLILCRLADAVSELDGVEGLRTHRSWWVARAAVTHVAKGDGRAVLTLVSGTEAPVSRSALPALRDKGWV